MNRSQILFASLIALIAVGVLFLSTSSYGIGVATDSMNYIAAADNFARGVGFFDYRDLPLVWWPPGYSFVLGIVRWLTGVPPQVFGGGVQIISAGLVMFCAAVVFRRCFSDQPLWFYLGVSSTALSLSTYTAAANIGTDIIFVLLLLLFFILARDALVERRQMQWVGLALLASVASLLRYVGVVLALTGGILILILYWKDFRKLLSTGLIFGILSLGPLAAWILGRNYLYYNTFTGPRISPVSIFIPNLQYAYTKICNWFLPISFTEAIPLFIPLLASLIVLLILNRKEDWRRWAGRLVSPPFISITIFSLIYVVSVAASVNPREHYGYYDDRYQLPLYIPLLTFFYLTLDELFLPHLRKVTKRWTYPVLVFFFIVWAIYPANLIYKFVYKSVQDGVAAYNLYNKRYFHESELVSFLREYPFDEGLPIYSNYSALVYFFTGRITFPSPADPENARNPDLAYLVENYQGWPNVPRAYLVLVETPGADRLSYYPVTDLQEIALVETIVEYKKVGGFYLVKPR